MAGYRMTEELKEAKEAAILAGVKILEIYKSDFEINWKADRSPVTEADLIANEIIVSRLQSRFPEYAILAEESKDDLSRMNNKWCWLIDPLDGTKEFVKKSDEFTVNIALVFDKKSILGVVYIPVTGITYYAIKGQGAWKEDRGISSRINVSKRTENIRATVSKSHAPANIGEILGAYGIKEIIYAGSAIKGCMIAEGSAEIYYRGGKTSEWDTAAMQCIVEEAGGVLRQLDDSEMYYNRENTLNEKGFYILNRTENRLELKKGVKV